MSAEGSVHPPTDVWVAAVHEHEGDANPIGAAVVVDADRLLTCAHVVVRADGKVQEPLWVSFPKADGCPWRLVSSWMLAYSPPATDLAVLILSRPIPADVEAAPLKYPKPMDLVNNAWWAFGFPDGDPIGDSANGRVGAALALGWVRLDAESRYQVRPGFSGGGLWSPDYEAVVGIVGQASGNGDGRAITMYQANLCFPDQNLAGLTSWSAREAGEVALAQWGWTLARDPEGARHWQQRARGAGGESEHGYRFRGRTAALTRLVQWLDRPQPDRQVLVVTGSPGVGKSAVLGRIVTTADADIRASLPPGDNAVKATVGSVSCAVHAKGKTAPEIAQEIARAASARLPPEANELAPAIRGVLVERGNPKFSVIIDALDEAFSPKEARVIIDTIVLPLVKTCSDVGAQVVVGTRRRDDEGELLDRFADSMAALDLDSPEYFAEEDLAAYSLACLQLAGDERPGKPYSDETLATRLADRIAAMSGQNFLVAGLIARSHGLHDEKAADPDHLVFPTTVDRALAAYLERLSPVTELEASGVLTALAFAEAPGLPVELWQLAVEAIYGKRVSGDDLTLFAKSPAAKSLIEAGGGAGTVGDDGAHAPVYRLFHQALNDALLQARSEVRPRASDEQELTLAFAGRGRLGKWEDAPDYLLRSLPGHAGAAGLVDDLLCDDAYLLHADLRRVLQVADKADSAQGHRRTQLLRLTPGAITAGPRDRAGLFSVTEALDNLGTTYHDSHWDGPYRAVWASVKPRKEQHAVLEGHRGRVSAVCPVTVAGRQLLASAGDDQTVRIWDPQTGEQRAVLQGHQKVVNAVCPVMADGRQLLASASTDHTVRIWDPQTGEQRAVLEGHRQPVNAVCPLTADGRQLLASASTDHTVRIWDPQTGEQRAVLDCHQKQVKAVCPVTVGGQELLATAGGDRTVRIWDPQTSRQRVVMEGHQGWPQGINGLCPVTAHGEQLLASAGGDRTVRIWDPLTGEQRAVLKGHRKAVATIDGVIAVCPVTVGGRQLLASAGGDGTVRIWDPETGMQYAILKGHQDRVNGVCEITVNGRQLLASAGDDGRVQIWEPETGGQQIREQPETGRQQMPGLLARLLVGLAGEGLRDRVNGVCEITVNDRQLLASAGDDYTVRIWDPQTGEELAVLEGHQMPVNAVCTLTAEGRPLLASAGSDLTVRIWDPQTGEERAVLKDHQGRVTGVCPITVDGRQLLASAGDDHTVRIWDPQTGKYHAVIRRTLGWLDMISGVCSVTVGGRQLLASAGSDRKVRIWNPKTGRQRAVLKGHQGRVRAVCPVTVDGRSLLASAGDDKTVRIWDPDTGEQRAALQGHQNRVNGLCPLRLDGRQLLVSASSDRTVQIWDPATGASLLTVPTYYTALAVTQVANSLAIGLSAGILVIRLNMVMSS